MSDIQGEKELHASAIVWLRRNFWLRGRPHGLSLLLRRTAHGVVFFSLLAPLARPAAAQTTADAKWEIEVHGGGMLASTNNPTGGTVSLPGPGESFTLAPRTTRLVPSWYFGDGTLLVNQIADIRTGVSGLAFDKITALDPILTSSVVQRQHGGSFGFRLGRDITPRFTAEFGFDYSRSPLKMSDTGLAGIEASRASFVSAFTNTVFSFAPPLVKSVTSQATIHSSEGYQTFTTGVLNINLTTGGQLIPYASVGGGVLVNGGDTPSATVVGNYQLQAPPGIPGVPTGLLINNETDTVTVRYSIDRAFVGVLGGGVKYAVSPRWGVRLDVRAHLGKNSLRNLVDANPTVAAIPLPGLPGSVFNTPTRTTLIVSTVPGVPSSLSGPPINGFPTFSGNGISSHTNITAGVFWRF